jgi:hypothetical protein
MKNKLFDDFFKQQMLHIDGEVADDVWNKIAAQKKNKKRVGFWFFNSANSIVMLFGIVALSIVLGYTIFSKSNSNHNSSSKENISNVEPLLDNPLEKRRNYITVQQNGTIIYEEFLINSSEINSIEINSSDIRKINSIILDISNNKNQEIVVLNASVNNLSNYVSKLNTSVSEINTFTINLSNEIFNKKRCKYLY